MTRSRSIRWWGGAWLALALVAGAPVSASDPHPVSDAVLPESEMATVEFTLLFRFGACGSNVPPVPLPGSRVTVFIDGRESMRSASDSGGRVRLEVPSRVPLEIRVYPPFDFPLAHVSVSAPPQSMLDLADLVAEIRFRPQLVGIRFAAGTTPDREDAILAACALTREGSDPQDPARILARAPREIHVSEAIACLLEHLPTVREALPGEYYPGCEP